MSMSFTSDNPNRTEIKSINSRIFFVSRLVRFPFLYILTLIYYISLSGVSACVRVHAFMNLSPMMTVIYDM
jgi:hypothetical protein